MRDSNDIERAIEDHGSTVWRVCNGFFTLKQDAQDAFQDSFLKYSLADDVVFADEEHRKAWLIRVSSNICRDMLKAAYRKDRELDAERADLAPAPQRPEDTPGSRLGEIMDAFRSLEDPPRFPLYLALYEGYTAPEIAAIVDAPVNTVYSWISRGKKMLKEALS